MRFFTFDQTYSVLTTVKTHSEHIHLREGALLDHNSRLRRPRSRAGPRDRDRLFERFFRGSNATSIAGTGVGLHLVAMVVAMHQGEVFAESLEGVGSRFVLRVPILPPATGVDSPDYDHGR
jgi:hypothetical protein